MTWNLFLQWLIDCLEKMKKQERTFEKGTIQMKKEEKKTEKTNNIPYMMNRELSWLKFNERVLNEAGNPRVPLAERLTFAAIYQSNLDEFYRVRVGTLMDQKKAVIYEQLMGELEPKGVRLINFNKLSAEEGKLLETYFDHEIAPYLSANIVSKQQPFPFLKNKDIYAVALLETKGGKTRTAIIPCSCIFRSRRAHCTVNVSNRSGD